MILPRSTRNGFLLAALLLPPTLASPQEPSQPVSSPGGKVALSFHLNASGTPVYALTFAGRPVVRGSRDLREARDAGGGKDVETLRGPVGDDPLVQLRHE